MIFLDERQVGFDTHVIGYPSIDGCHAIAALTDNGLFGFHVLGGERKDSFASRAGAFAAYIQQHHQNAGIRHLFGTCFRTSKRGYTGNKRDGWKKEMKAYAKALKYKGPISGYDLDREPDWPGGDSAYVVYQRVNNGVRIFCKPWSQVTKAAVPAATLSGQVNRQTTGSDGTVKDITFGNNHTGNVTFAELMLVPASMLDTTKT